MTDTQILFGVLGFWYLLQCVALVPRECFVFRPWWGGKSKILLGEDRPLPGSRGFVLANPFDPASGVLICPPFPLFLSPEGIAVDPSCTRPAFARESEGSRFLGFGEIERVGRASKEVRVNGARFYHAHSESAAEHIASLLQELVRCPELQRRALIRRELQRMLDTEEILRRLNESAAKSRALHWMATSLLVFLFFVAPLVSIRWGLVVTWPYLLVVLVSHLLAISWLFARTHRAFYPAEKEHRWNLSLTAVLSPIFALRAGDSLVRDLLCPYHPMAIARVLCTQQDFLRLASRTLREVHFPSPSTSSADAPELARCEQNFREEQRRAFEGFIMGCGAVPAELLRPPVPDSEAVQGYCPRCWSQYVVFPGVCADCGRIPLHAFPAGSAREKVRVASTLERLG